MAEDEMVKLFRDLARFPELKFAHIHEEKDGLLVESGWDVRNLSTMLRSGSQCSQAVTPGSTASEAKASPARHVPALEHTELISRKGQFVAYLIQAGRNIDSVRYILLYRPDNTTSVIDLTKSKLHGKVYGKSSLADLQFSPDCSKLVLVAEERLPKATSLLSRPNDEDEPTDPSGRGEEYHFRADWGEQNTGNHRSVVVVVPTSPNSNSDYEDDGRVLLTPPPCFGMVCQLQWVGPEDLMGVAYYDESPRLGMIYCPTRDSVIFHVNLKDKIFTPVTPRGWWVGSLRVSPDLSRLVYLRGPVGGPHVREAQLVVASHQSPNFIEMVTPDVVLDYQADIVLPNEKVFPGVTGMTTLPERCFLDNEGSTLALTNPGPFSKEAYIIDTDSQTLRQVLMQEFGSVELLDVTPQWIVYSTSSITKTAEMRLAKVDADIKKGYTVEDWCVLVPGQAVPGVSPDWMAQYLLEDKPPHPDRSYDDIPVPVIYCGPTTKQEEGTPFRPLIVFVHGGPHVSFPNSNYLITNLFMAMGYSVVMPIYRGSLGLGVKGIHSLPGHVGTADVADCHAVAIDCLKRYSDVLDADNVYLFGGSHGGYLSLFLSAKFPDFYRAAAVRNPVTDMVTLTGTSDIPDWTHVEAGTSQSHNDPPSNEALVKMASASPLWHIRTVKAPTIFFLGANDRRVPCMQGIKYYELLKHHGVPTRANMYPKDEHPLRSLEAESDSLLSSLCWFQKYKKSTAEQANTMETSAIQ